MENYQKNKTVMGIDENIEGLLCYVLGWITGIVSINDYVKSLL
jgi:malate synthase